ncbi:hypothetical protein IAR55_004057 [Kwoniella newhampshirensis]|uniref:C3H1-type domain-containing protein n=1 Tax=Kwoniella newhampshirensis TaxID=1651941 RepID=A0AAW0YMI2_9TREE
MAPVTTPQERQKWLLQQEIAKLSGAISRHSTTSQPSFHPYRGRPATRGYLASVPRGRGRGRGRGGSYALDFRTASSKPSSSAEPSRPSSSASIDHPAGPSELSRIDKEIGEVPLSSASKAPAATTSISDTNTTWVKGKGRTGNMSLMTTEKRAKLRTQRPKPPPQIQVLNSTIAASNGSKQVVIDGIIFQFEQDGKKLTRIGEASPSGPSSMVGGYTPTRKSLSFGGGRYKRTSRGNLILRRQGSTTRGDQFCRYFTKTGRCNFGLTCSNKHDPNRVAICPRSLRGQCELGPSACPLSHTPSPHNTPSCVRFQATSSCSKPNCPYPHVKVSDDAPVCQAFARDGWCDNEAGTCPELHVWECQEYREKGTCSRKGKCGLRHVLRAEKGRMDVQEEQHARPKEGKEKEGGFEEQTEFIEFDQGSPGVISDDGEAEESEAEDESAEEEEEDDNEDDDIDDDDSEDDGDEEESIAEDGDADLGKPMTSSPIVHHVPSDITMDADEVDEEAVLSVVF